MQVEETLLDLRQLAHVTVLCRQLQQQTNHKAAVCMYAIDKAAMREVLTGIIFLFFLDSTRLSEYDASYTYLWFSQQSVRGF